MKQSFEEFVKQVESRARRKKPVRTKTRIEGTLLAKRNKRVAIREAALRGVSCVVLYRKSTTGEVKRYEVIPMEYASRRMHDRKLRKVLWVCDVREGKMTKCFVVRGIIKVALTNRRLRCPWPIRIM